MLLQSDLHAVVLCGFVAVQVLEGYSSWLENRVVSRFDTAIVEGNYAQQAQVVAIMTELNKEKSIAKVRHAVGHIFVDFVLLGTVLLALRQCPCHHD